MLELKHVNAFYGKSHVLFNVTLDVKDGEIVGLLGRNGVGKSTTLKTIVGEVNPAGSILFKGEAIHGLKPYEIVRRGMGYVPENRCIFPSLTVYQNLLMGEKKKGVDTRWKVQDLFEFFPLLEKRSNVNGGDLSGGEQQMLAICRTLMGDPDLIMIDEPTEGLAPLVIDGLIKMLDEIRRRGVAILLVEQKLAVVLSISHRVFVMAHGSIVFCGSTDEFSADESVRKEWLEV